MIYGHHFGHEIYAEAEPSENGGMIYRTWKFKDTGEIVKDTHNRKCPSCGLKETKEGHDPCIANLPNVEFACCGHGLPHGKTTSKGKKIDDYGKPYVKMNDGEVHRFNSIEELKKFVKDYDKKSNL